MSSEGVLASLREVLADIEKTRNQIFLAKTSGELNSALAQLNAHTQRIQRMGFAMQESMRNSLYEQFKANSPTGAVDPKVLYRLKKAQAIADKALIRSATDLRTWGKQFAINVAAKRDLADAEAKAAAIRAKSDTWGKITTMERQLERIPSVTREMERDLNKIRRLKGKDAVARRKVLEENLFKKQTEAKVLQAKIDKLKATAPNKEELKALEDRAIAAKAHQRVIPDEPSVLYRGKKREFYTPADSHFQMVTRSNDRLAANLGTIAAAKNKSGFVLVHDGPNCGLRSHDGGNKVNGQTWSWEEAMQFPMSHPNCTRSFSIAEGPPGSKALAAQKRSLGLDRKSLQAIKKAATLAATVGTAVTIGNEVMHNPFVKAIARDILDDVTFPLSPVMQRYLNRLTSYRANEETAFKAYGDKFGAKSQQEFNQKILASLDDNLATESFLVKSGDEVVQITAAQAQVLGVPFRLPKARLMEALDDYGDWIIHRTALEQDLASHLTDEAIWAGINQGSMARTASIKYDIGMPEGVRFKAKWYKTVLHIKEVYKANPEKANRDLIRLGATIVDPTPWLHTNLGHGFKFSIGMTTRGREDLAVKLYEILKQSKALSPAEVRWAEQLGVDMSMLKQPASITKADIVKAFTPRVSFQPGKLFNATLALQSGKLQSIIRVYPPGTLQRYIHLQSRLLSVDMEKFISILRSGDGTPKELLARALKEVTNEDIITTVGLFRNSPLELSMRMTGLQVDSWAIKALPDNKFIRYSYRFWLDRDTLTQTALAKVAHGKAHGDTLGDILATMTSREVNAYRAEMARRTIDGAMSEGFSFDEALKLVSKVEARAYKLALDDWRSGITVLPNHMLGFKLDGFNIKQMEAFVGLKAKGKSLLEIAKRTRYGYDTLLEWWAENKKQFEELIFSIDPNELKKVRSLDDLTRLLQVSWGPNRIDKAFEVGGGINLDFADEYMLSKPNVAMDVRRFAYAWTREFPDLPIPKIIVRETLDDPWMAEQGRILVRKDVIDAWDEVKVVRAKLVRHGWFPRNSEDMVAEMMHEAAHSYLAGMDIRPLIREAVRSYVSWPGGLGVSIDDLNLNMLSKETTLKQMQAWVLRPEVQKKIAIRMSGYSSKYGWDEILAEAFSEYFANPNSRKMANAIIDEFKNQATTQMHLFNTNLMTKRTWEWNPVNSREINKRRNEILARMEKTLNLHAKAHKADPLLEELAKNYKPTWTTWAKGSQYEGLVIDKKLNENPEVVEDIKKAFLKWKELFPDKKFPPVQYHPYSLDDVSSREAVAFFDMVTGRMHINQISIELWADNEELRALSIFNARWHPDGALRAENTVFHELGHYMTRQINSDQVPVLLKGIADALRETPGVAMGTSNNLGRFVDALDASIAELKAFTPDEMKYLTDMLVQGGRGKLSSYSFLIVVDNQVEDQMKKAAYDLMQLISGYGSTDLIEMIAEMFNIAMITEPNPLGTFRERISFLMRNFMKYT